MIRTYELTDEEYRTVMSALRHAKDDAVHEDAVSRFNQVLRHMVEEYELQEGQPITGSEVNDAE